MMSSPDNIVREPDVENMLLDENENASPNKEPHIKHPMNPYVLFYLYRRKEIASLYPKIRIREISKQVGAEWNLLTAEQKQPFIDEAKRLSEKHKRDHPKYKFEPYNLKAFKIWSRDRRLDIAFANPHLRYSEINKQLSAEWKLLTIEEKQLFIDEAKRPRKKHLGDSCQYTFTYFEHKNSRQELNDCYSVYSSASTSSSIQPICHESQHNYEESPLDLYARKARQHPFIDESKRLRAEHLRDQPDYKCTYQPKEKSVMNTLEPSFVPHSMSSISLPNFDAQESMSSTPVSAQYTEQGNNPSTEYIPTYDLYSTIHPAILNDSDTRCTESRISTSVTGLNVLPQSVSRYQYDYMNSEQYACGHVSNINDTVHNNTRSSCNVYNKCPEAQMQNELSAFELFLKKYQ